MNAGCKYLYNAQARAASLVQRQSSPPPGRVTHISRQKTTGVAGRGLGPALPRPWPPSRWGWWGCLPARGLQGCFMSLETFWSTSVLEVAEKQLFKGSLRLLFMGCREAGGTLRSLFPGETLPIPMGGGRGEPPPPGTALTLPTCPWNWSGEPRVLGEPCPYPGGRGQCSAPDSPTGVPSCLTPLPGVDSQRGGCARSRAPRLPYCMPREGREQPGEQPLAHKPPPHALKASLFPKYH